MMTSSKMMTKMNDKDFLNWIADRFVNVYGESENVDFVLKLRAMARRMSTFEDTPIHFGVPDERSRP
jgi:hypothetical protein